jgi:hypothetical protein
MTSPRRRHFTYQYRLVWKYVGEKNARQHVSDRAFAILQMMRRIGTKEPWTGCTETQMKRSWAYLARRLNQPFEVVAEMSLRQALVALQASFPKLEYIRVEMRQVADWVQVVDPMRVLATRASDKRAMRSATLVDSVDALSRSELDAWRWIPDPEADKFRRRIG